MKFWMDVHHTYGEAVKTVCRELRQRAPARWNRTPRWPEADVTVDLTVDSPIGTLTNVPASLDEDQHGWHRMMLLRLTGPQKKVLFPICCFETSEVLRYACREAKIVFSFLPDFPERLGETRMNWRLTPLGVNPEDWPAGPHWANRTYDIYTWGYVAESEYIDVVHQACAVAHKRHLHSGKDFPSWRGTPTYTYLPPAPRGQVGERYRQSRYANAMREPCGFELAALEATLSGARPICLDLPCYRYWFDTLPRYVRPHDAAVNTVMAILDKDDDMPGDDEQGWVADMFNWDRVARRFWDNVEAAL